MVKKNRVSNVTPVAIVPLAYSVKDFASIVDLSPRNLFALLKRGEGPRLTAIGKRRIITHEDGMAWLRRRSEASQQPQQQKEETTA